MKYYNKGKRVGKRLTPFSIFLIVLASLLCLAMIFSVAGIIYVKKNFNYKYNKITNDPEKLGFQEVIDDTVINIALFGVDTRDENSFSGRSDSIMILSVNTTDKRVRLISVMRDSLVPITTGKEDLTFNKINSAYASGGPELAIRTLNNIFALDISEYATVNFNGMTDIIDAVGGVEATITSAEISHINSSIGDQVKKYGGKASDYRLTSAGTVHLNGVQALAYSRIRYVSNAAGTSNDYGRTDRQRYIMSQLFAKATQMNKSRYIDLIKSLSPCCETSLSYTEILDLAVDVLLHSPTLEETRIPSTDYTMKAPNAGVGSVVYYDLEYAANIIHAFIYDDIKPEDYILQNGISQNDWYTNGYKPPVIKSSR